MNPTDGALIAAAGALLLLALAGVLGVEWYLLHVGHKPITTYTRNVVLRWPAPAMLVMNAAILVVGWLAAHFITDAGCG